MHNTQMMEKVCNSQGFIAALDQSGGSTPKALAGYGIEADEFSNDDEMFALIHQMRVRIMTSPVFTHEKILGAILFEKTMNGDANGQPVPAYLWSKGIVPFLKVDKGLEDEADGVQMMVLIPELEALCAHAIEKGMFGTKMRSVINLASHSGISAIVKQQFEVGMQILTHGLMPILEPEVNIKSPDRADCDRILRDELLITLNALPGDQQVVLKLSIPANAGLYNDLISHPRVARLVALSGGFSTDEACRQLASNKGMIASFSRALLEKLRYSMSDVEFDAVLGGAIDQIYSASAS
jgi:fructose-bisphosphate aldolase, class I